MRGPLGHRSPLKRTRAHSDVAHRNVLIPVNCRRQWPPTMGRMLRPVRTVEEFYAHALAIEREARDRYAELAAWFTGRGEEMLAGLCTTLAEAEGAHYR